MSLLAPQSPDVQPLEAPSEEAKRLLPHVGGLPRSVAPRPIPSMDIRPSAFLSREEWERHKKAMADLNDPSKRLTKEEWARRWEENRKNPPAYAGGLLDYPLSGGTESSNLQNIGVKPMGLFDSVGDFIDKIPGGSLINPVLGIVQGQREKDRVKEQNQANALLAQQLGQRAAQQVPAKVKAAEIEGRRRGEGIFGPQDELGRNVRDIIKQRIDLAQGMNAEQLAALRETGRRQVAGQTGAAQQQLLAAQGAQGLTGATAAAQQSQLGIQGANARAQLERDILGQQFQAQMAGQSAADKALRSAILAQEAFASGAAQRELGVQSAANQLQIGTIPGQQAPPGIFSGLIPTVICTELAKQGILKGNALSADVEHGHWIREVHPEVFVGYLTWARPYVKLMKKSKFATWLAWQVVLPWSKHIAHTRGYTKEGSLFGKAINHFGMKLFGLIGNIKIRVFYGRDQKART